MAGTMGVDIRVPSGWEVESKVVEGKKCIGTHNGSCKYSISIQQQCSFTIMLMCFRSEKELHILGGRIKCTLVEGTSGTR